MNQHGKYSVANAERFRWSSITGSLHPDRVALLHRHLQGKSVLDAGCGGGGYVKYLASSGWDATGLEKFDEFLEVARHGDPGGDYVQGDITNIPFDDGRFDSVYSFDVIEHVDLDGRAVSELCRVARERVIIAVPAHDENSLGHGVTYGHYQDLTHLRTYTADSLGKLIREAGQSRFVIDAELPVDLRGLAIEHLDQPKWPGAGMSVGSIFGYMREKSANIVLRRLLRHATYKPFFSGLFAVVDVS